MENFDDEPAWDKNFELFDKYFKSTFINTRHPIVDAPRCTGNFDECIDQYGATSGQP
jgi:hypothetical protein